jgi:hypothetical protein
MKAVCPRCVARALLALLLLPAGVAAQATPVAPPDSRVLAAFDAALQQVAAAPVIGAASQASLARKLTNARAAFVRRQPCTAVSILAAYVRETQAQRRHDALNVLEALFATGRSLVAQILRGVPTTAPCAGHESFGRAPTLTLTSSDNTRLAGAVQFGEATMSGAVGGNEQFTKVLVPGVEFVGAPGFPGVPVVRHVVAVPRGAIPRLYSAEPTIAETVDVNLYPFQRSPGDQAQQVGFGDPPFIKNPEAYASHGPFPPSVCAVTVIGNVRDLTAAQLTCAAGRYDPVDDVLTLFSGIEFDLRFEGGTGYFVSQRTLSPFEPPILDPDHLKLFVNWPEILKHVDYSQWFEPDCHGEELLIFTPLDLKAAADRLALWKKEKGILTSVVVYGEGAPEYPPVLSAADINYYVWQRYDRCTVRPSYILLFGDAEQVPTWYVPTTYGKQTATDYPYAVGRTPAPSVALGISPPSYSVGRIPVDTAEQAGQVVDKIIAYEKTPPSNNDFYRNATVLAQFQCCQYKDFPVGISDLQGLDERTFVENVEFTRNALVANGYTVERIYTKEVDPLYTKNKTPKYYQDGTPLPADLGPGSGFAWDGSHDDVVAAFDAGRFLILQRDHGSWNGWKSWQFERDAAAELNNGGLLPVVFSMSCSTGFFDNETNPGEIRPLEPGNPYPSTAQPWLGTGPGTIDETYFAERLLRNPNGGAIAMIGATRDSSSWPNDVLTRGLFDAVWPGTIPDFGANVSTRRLGDVLNHAKNYLLSQQGADDGWQQFWRDEPYLYNLIGDPTLEMWTALPGTLSTVYFAELFTSLLKLHYPIEGTTITAFQFAEDGMVPIGRAVVKDGVATLDYVEAPRPDLRIFFSASKENAISRLLWSHIDTDVR